MTTREAIEKTIQESKWSIDWLNTQIKDAQESIKFALTQDEAYQARFIPGYAKKLKESCAERDAILKNNMRLKYILETTEVSA